MSQRSSHTPALQHLLDRHEIRTLMLDYAAAVDRRDFDDVGACFREDVNARYGDATYTSRKDLVEFISGVRFFHTTMHCMGTHAIAIQGDHAHMVTAAMLTHHGVREDGSPFVYDNSEGLYVDALSRDDGRWIIDRRGGEPARNGRAHEVAAEDDATRWLLDRAEIEDLVMRQALAIDRRDAATIAADLAPDVRVDFDGDPCEGAEAVASRLSQTGSFASTTHFTAGPRVHLAGDEAFAETTLLVTEREPGARLRDAKTRPVRWHDRFVRRDGRFRLLVRGRGVAEPGAGDEPTVAPVAAIQRLLDRAHIRNGVLDALRALDCDTAGLTHFPGNLRITFDGDAARAETYLYRIEQRPDGTFSHWGEGAVRALDRLTRTASGWTIAERTLRGNHVDVFAADGRFPTRGEEQR